MNIEEVELNLSIPSDRVGMVLMQPYLTLSPVEPFKWTAQARTSQVAAIENALRIAATNDHGATRTSFTIFPEYSVPGVEGFDAIENTVASTAWPNDSVVLAGLDGLTATEYTALCNRTGVRVAQGSAHTQIANGHWINCLAMWVKCSDGQLVRFIQPKIAPNWDEANITCEQMHCGSSVFLYKARFQDGLECRFLSLICFDWIGKDHQQNAIYSGLLQTLVSRYPTTGIDLHWIFVLQHNPKPSHPNFLNLAKSFFEERTTFAKVNRDYCTLVFANNAGGSKPGEYEYYGHSSLLFSQQIASFKVQGCPPTFSGFPSTTRSSQILVSCKDVIFRERGACIHSVCLTPPRYVNAGVTGKQLPLARASVHPTDNGERTPRTPGAPVPGVIKWINDSIDKLQPTGERHTEAPFAIQSNNKFKEHTSVLVKQKAQILGKKMEYASAPDSSEQSGNSDKWATTEADALKTVLDTVTVVSLVETVDLETEDFHADISTTNENANLISIQGKTHLACRRHFDKLFTGPAREPIILVSRDEDNTPITGREHKIIDTNRDQSLGSVITDPAGAVYHTDFSSILVAFKESGTEAVLKEKLDELFKQ